jgi:lysophospholipase L1-like esterase
MPAARRWQLGALLGVSLVLPLLAAEGLARLLYVPVDPGAMPARLPEPAYSPAKDRYGFREEPLPPDLLAADRVRVLLLGDSFTFGHGVARGEDRFSDIVERRLRLKLGGARGRRFHLYNAGRSATEPRRWLEYARLLLPVYRPQHVVAVFTLRDGTNLRTSYLFYREQLLALRAPYEGRWWYRRSRLGRFAADRLVQRAFAALYLRQYVAAYRGSPAERAEWERQQQHLREIRDECRRAGASFHLVIFPMLFGLEGPYRFAEVEEEILGFARAAGVPAFSLTPAFAGRESASLWVAPYDQHPNEAGHRVAAEALYPYLREVVGAQTPPPDAR